MKGMICLLLACQSVGALEISGGPDKTILKHQSKQVVAQTKTTFGQVIQALSGNNWQEKIKPLIFAEGALAENLDVKDQASLINRLGDYRSYLCGHKTGLKNILVFSSQYRIVSGKQIFHYRGIETCVGVSGKLDSGAVVHFALSFFVKNGEYLLWRFDDETDLA